MAVAEPRSRSFAMSNKVESGIDRRGHCGETITFSMLFDLEPESVAGAALGQIPPDMEL